MRQTMYIDGTMREPALLRCNYNFTIKGDRVLVDMRGSSPELYNRPINSLLSTQAIGITLAMAHYIWPDLPAAQAILDNFDFVSDPASILDATDEVPVGLCMQGAFKALTATELSFSKFYFGASKRYAKTKAGWFNQPQSIIYGGVNQHLDSVGNMCGELNGMAGGAKHDDDGEHSLAPNFGAMTDLGETEAAEEGLPFIYAISKRLWPDNTGFGKFRGGAAYQFGLMRFGDQPFGFQGFTTGTTFPSTLGLWGGYACPTYAVCRIRGKNLFEEFKAKPELFKADMFELMNEQAIEGATYLVSELAVDFDFYGEGELFMQSQGAGGGYGDVLERDPQRVMKDVEEGIASPDTARDLYKVVFDENNLVVDGEATQEARAAERRARISRGSDWDQFIADNVTAEPPSHIPFFGAWNDSAELYAGPYGKGAPGQLPPLMFPDPLVVENAKLKQQLEALTAQAGDK
jgi:N-methylhydantoinase B/oxoprolinase/acetone carboxylase alpha subunit